MYFEGKEPRRQQPISGGPRRNEKGTTMPATNQWWPSWKLEWNHDASSQSAMALVETRRKLRRQQPISDGPRGNEKETTTPAANQRWPSWKREGNYDASSQSVMALVETIINVLCIISTEYNKNKIYSENLQLFC